MVLMCGIAFLPWSLGGSWSDVFLAIAAIVILSLSGRSEVRITADGARGSVSVLGIPVRRYDLGRWPRAEAGVGWNWSEIALFPEDEALASKLHDNERFVLAQYSDSDEARQKDGRAIAAWLRQEIERLHGPRPPAAPESSAGANASMTR